MNVDVGTPFNFCLLRDLVEVTSSQTYGNHYTALLHTWSPDGALQIPVIAYVFWPVCSTFLCHQILSRSNLVNSDDLQGQAVTGRHSVLSWVGSIGITRHAPP